MGRRSHLMRGRSWIHDWTNWRLCNALGIYNLGLVLSGKNLPKEIFAKSRETYCSINDRFNAWKTIQKHLCLGHKRSQMKQLLPKTWITFITITVRQSRMFIMQVWWRFYDLSVSWVLNLVFWLLLRVWMIYVFHFFWCFLFSCFGWKVNISGQHGSDAGDLLLLVHHKVTRGVGLKWKIVTSVTYRGVRQTLSFLETK